MEAVDDIARIFVAFNHQVQRVPVRHDMRWFNVCRRADLVFNLCEGVRGVAQWEDHVVGTLELAGIAYTGCGPWTTSACRRKADRKSTRLNSSHSQISYAVFCLKKKKTTE